MFSDSISTAAVSFVLLRLADTFIILYSAKSALWRHFPCTGCHSSNVSGTKSLRGSVYLYTLRHNAPQS